MTTIRLLQTCMIAGLPRSPVEGLQTVPAEDAKRLIDANMAEDADADVERTDVEDGDGLDKQKVTDLRQLAATEGASFATGANKDGILAAIRARRDLFAGTDLAVVSDAELRKLVPTDTTVAEDADTATLITAISSAGG